jgi:uncharacterized protein (UPF0147 family)
VGSYNQTVNVGSSSSIVSVKGVGKNVPAISNFGTTSILGTFGGPNPGKNGYLFVCDPFTPPSNCNALSISIYEGVSSGGNVQLALYSGASAPTNLIAKTGTQALVSSQWNTVSLPQPTLLSASTQYWIAFELSTSAGNYYFSSDAYNLYYVVESFGTFPATLSGLTSTLQAVSLYVTTQPNASASSIVALKSVGKNVSDACASSIVALKSVGKNVSDVCASSIVALKSVGKNVSDVCASSIVALKSVGKNVSDACASSIVALKSVGKNVSDVCASSIVALKSVGKNVSDACASSIVALKSVGKNVSDACASSIVALKSVGKNVSDACASGATILASKTWYQAVVTVCSSSIGVGKSIGKNIVVACSSSISTIKGIWKLVTAYCSSSVTNNQPTGGQANVTLAPQGTVQSDIIVQGTSAVDFSVTGTAEATLT